MIIYLYSKCSTCKKALHFLKNKKITFTLKEITKEPPTILELKKMLNFKEGNIKKLLNTSGLLYREMRLGEKLNDMSVDQILTLLNQNGMLIKRPFLLTDDFGLTGFNEREWSQKI